MRTSKAVSIYTISAEAGVSPATVSRALRNSPLVSSAVREKVFNIAEARAFRPSFISNRVLNICALVQQVSHHPLDFGPYLSRVLEGVAEYCQEHGLEMSILGSTSDDLNRKDVVRELRRRGADGAIVLRASDESEYISKMQRQGFPFFCLFHYAPALKDKAFTIRDQALAVQAVRHLLELGHEHIGIITDVLAFKHQECRLDGYRKALLDHGLTVDTELCYTRTGDKPSKFCNLGQIGLGVDGVRELKRRRPEITAVFCTTDLIAEGALSWLYQQGIRVPDAFSVVGFDDYPAAQFACPPLTTIRVPLKEIAYQAAKQVHWQCLNETETSAKSAFKSLNGELMVRSSTGRPPR